MGTKIVTFCDVCERVREDSSSRWYSVAITTDGGEVPSKGGAAFVCSEDCLKTFLSKVVGDTKTKEE